MGFVGFYCVVLGFTGLCWVLLGFYWVLSGLNLVLLSLTGLETGLTGFHRFWRVGSGFSKGRVRVLPGFYRVSSGSATAFLAGQ